MVKKSIIVTNQREYYQEKSGPEFLIFLLILSANIKLFCFLRRRLVFYFFILDHEFESLFDLRSHRHRIGFIGRLTSTKT